MRNYFWGLFLVALGTLLLLDHIGMVDFDEIMVDYWPLILVFWGLSILAGRRRDKRLPVTQNEGNQNVDYDLLHQSSVMGDIHSSVTSTKFKGGSVSTVIGDSLIDLAKASFDEGEHALRLHGVFGDTTVILPKDAAVSISANSVFGGLTILGQRKEGVTANIRVATPNYETAPNRLKITVSRVFGNVRID